MAWHSFGAFNVLLKVIIAKKGVHVVKKEFSINGCLGEFFGICSKRDIVAHLIREDLKNTRALCIEEGNGLN